VLVVCPASLCVKWREEMQEKFGLEFRIVDADLLRELRRARGPYVNPWTHFPRLIASVDWLKRERPMRLLKDVLPAGPPTLPRAFDLLIVDEVHGCAPAGRGRYATDSLRTRAIRAIAPHFEHRLFLSATPHNGYQESFQALLELLDDQRFARGVPPDRGWTTGCCSFRRRAACWWPPPAPRPSAGRTIRAGRRGPSAATSTGCAWARPSVAATS
jgi:superfamily II DNA or RNA helicase